MTTPQTIVAATDFSENATRAVRQAAYLAKAWDARLFIVHVFNDSAWASLKAIYSVQAWTSHEPLKTAEVRLERLCREIGEEFGIQVASEILRGSASQQIGEVVAARQAGLLVVGEHGENWVSDVVLGGTALKVLEAARVPVLLVRRAEPALYGNIVVATDFSAADEHAARMALQCFPEARHTLLHAWRIPFETSMRMGGARVEDIERYREHGFADAAVRLEAFARRCEAVARSGRLEPVVLYGSPAAVVFEQARARAGDLIVIGKHGKRGLHERLLGSVTQNILYHAGCDVLLSA
jgi:nucleotide-binding universal stress UspA family protein